MPRARLETKQRLKATCKAGRRTKSQTVSGEARWRHGAEGEGGVFWALRFHTRSCNSTAENGSRKGGGTRGERGLPRPRAPTDA